MAEGAPGVQDFGVERDAETLAKLAGVLGSQEQAEEALKIVERR
jgi:hypothetical protein